MEYQEAINRVDYGEEFLFYYKGEAYWISQNKDGYYLTYIQVFNTAQELFDKGHVFDKSLLEIWDDIEVVRGKTENISYQEAIKKVQNGDGINFHYEAGEYWIYLNDHDGYELTYTQDFKTAQELFDKGRVFGKSLLELWDHIEI